MSIVLCWPTDKGTVFYSDGIAYDETGTIVGMASKVISVAAGTAALAWVGSGPFGPVFAANVPGHVISFDDLASIFSDLAQHTLQVLKDNNYPWGVSASVVIAGWSDKQQRHMALHVGSRPKQVVRDADGELSERAAWQVEELSGCWISTIPDEEYRLSAGVHGFDDDTMSNDEFAIRMVCAARLSSRSLDEGEVDFPGSGIRYFAAGGFLQRTFVGKDEFSQAIIHRWPDQIGERINPLSGDAVPSFLTEEQPEPAA